MGLWVWGAGQSLIAELPTASSASLQLQECSNWLLLIILILIFSPFNIFIYSYEQNLLCSWPTSLAATGEDLDEGMDTLNGINVPNGQPLAAFAMFWSLNVTSTLL